MSKEERIAQLHRIGKGYVQSLGDGHFESIPYHEQAILRAPINPGGSAEPMQGRDNIRDNWWAPLPSLVAGTDFINSYVDVAKSAVAVEFLCHIQAPACTLRIMDRFKVSEDGLITDQENFFDPRAITNPT